MRTILVLACLLWAVPAFAQPQPKPIITVRGSESFAYEVQVPTMADAQAKVFVVFLDGATTGTELVHLCGTGPSAGLYTCAAALATLPLKATHTVDTLLRDTAVGGPVDGPRMAAPFDLRRSLSASPLNLRIRP